MCLGTPTRARHGDWRTMVVAFHIYSSLFSYIRRSLFICIYKSTYSTTDPLHVAGDTRMMASGGSWRMMVAFHMYPGLFSCTCRFSFNICIYKCARNLADPLHVPGEDGEGASRWLAYDDLALASVSPLGMCVDRYLLSVLTAQVNLPRDTLQRTATHCQTLQHTAKHNNTQQYTTTHCNPLQHTATHCNTLPRTATRGNTPEGICVDLYGVSTVSRID